MKKLLVNKGYTQVHNGEYGTDLYVAIDPHTGAICLIVANEGSQYFKEIVLTDEQIEFLFAKALRAPVKTGMFITSKAPFSKSLLKEDFHTVYSIDKEVAKGVKKTNEALVRDAKDEEVISLARVAYIDNMLADLCIVNLTYQEVSIFCGYLSQLVEQAQEAEKKEEEK